MVDFKQLKDKAQGLLTEHSDKIQDGITKAGGFAGSKVGRDKVDPIQAKLKGFVDKAARKDGGSAPPTAPTPPPSATPNPPPPSTPNPPPTAV